MVQNERDTAKAELDALKSRMRLQDDGERLRESFSHHSVRPVVYGGMQETSIEVDLTQDDFRQPVQTSQYMHHRTEIALDDSDNE